MKCLPVNRTETLAAQAMENREENSLLLKLKLTSCFLDAEELKKTYDRVVV